MTQKLPEIYRNLILLQQQILRLFSVIYFPVTRTSFTECFKRVGILDGLGKPFLPKTIKPYLDSLIAADLLKADNRQLLQCDPLLREIATRDAVRVGEFDKYVAAVEAQFPIKKAWKGDVREFQNQEEFIREVRIGIYRQDLAFIDKQFQDYNKYKTPTRHISFERILALVSNEPFDSEWMNNLNTQFYERSMSAVLHYTFLKLLPAQEALNLLSQKSLNSNVLIYLLTEQLLLRGKLEEAEKSLDNLQQDYGQESAYRGWISFLKGDNPAAIEFYTIAIKAIGQENRKREVFLDNICGLFYVLALLQEGSPQSLAIAENHANWIAKQSEHFLSKTYQSLEKLIKILRGDLSHKEEFKSNRIAPYPENHCLETLLNALCLYWVDRESAANNLPPLLEPICQVASQAGYDWIAAESAALLSKLRPKSSYKKTAQNLRENLKTINIVDIIRPKEAWELSLNALLNLHQDPEKEPQQVAKKRLAWFLSLYGQLHQIQPKEQVINAQGVWSKGRNVSLKRLHREMEDFDYLTHQDIKVCSYLKYSSDYYGSSEYNLSSRAITALIGHPLVFSEDGPNLKLEVVKGKPELSVEKKGEDVLVLKLTPDPKNKQEIIIVRDSPTRIKVIELDSQYTQIAEIIGQNNHLEIPIGEQERVLSAIRTVSRLVTVHSDIGGEIEGVIDVPPQSQPHIHLLPLGEGLKVVILVQPFADGGPYFRPSIGRETIITEIGGIRTQTKRNLPEEKALGEQVITACPTLSRQEERDGEWLIEVVEDCLELLLELQALPEQVMVKWPEGEKYKVSSPRGFEQLHLTIARQKDWFEASGELRLEDEKVLDMLQLLEMLRHSPSRFIALGDGQFLALTQEFRRRLEELGRLTEKSGKKLRFHPLAAVALEDVLEQARNLTTDKHWQKTIKRFHETENLVIEVPSTLQAELRDYQIEGFKWLTRLSHWGAGACLADDMGLGKTLQALAVILTRAAQGSTLVIAPTSVCLNWMSEAERFAPTLRIRQLGSGDRQKLVKDLQPFDLLICSYGLLQQEDVIQLLAKVQWETIILDEAQAIKNFATKRSQAAMELKGNFKVITTGTPVENHLGELWNLFRFINPGLLGSLESFNQRFAFPIEKYGDKQARNHLKKLIQPFLLRRTKTQVLQELPPRTEITLQVELNPEEVALYEALRRDAILKLADAEGTGGQKHLQILVEIMKLRRACCNPRLVLPNTEIGSSKLQVLAEILQEMQENRHKALIFSQFVDHLQIVKEFLEQEKIIYQYLDGSTPAVERKKRVDAFQSGLGDVFLISLKAGGTGLNLTAADYVIHLDPWWNPAVEDQASDRAHRMGQQRPVTIYRLVAKGTIEEKILELHNHKRDLADSLLDGSDVSGKLSAEELLKLITQ